MKFIREQAEKEEMKRSMSRDDLEGLTSARGLTRKESTRAALLPGTKADAEALFGQIAQLNGPGGASMQRKVSSVGRKPSALTFGGFSLSEKVSKMVIDLI